MHVVLIDESVAVCDPLLARVALVAGCSPVVLLTPYGIAHLEPEGRCPCSHGGVEEHVGLYLAELLLDSDDTFGIFFARGSWIRSYGAELSADPVELEEVEVVVVEHKAGAVEEYLVVGGVGELHSTSRAPVVAAVVAAGAVTAHGTEPSTNLRVHGPCLIAQRLEAIGEVGVELPSAVLIPSVVPHE